MEIGERIASYRKKSGMTQADLGTKLNVTAQAVSKWENGLSEPDIATLQKMSALFNVSVDTLLGNENAASAAETDAVEPQTETAQPAQPQVVETKIVETKLIVGYCGDCKKPIFQDDKYEVHSAGRGAGRAETLRCKECENKYQIKRRHEEHNKTVASRNKGFLVGGLVGGIWIIIGVAALLWIKDYIDLWFPFVSGYAVFAFTAQLFWGEFLQDFLLFFVRILKFPGLIFTLDLHGIIWFICVKLLFAVIGFIFTAAIFLIGLGLAFCIAAFSFPFAVYKMNKKIKSFK